MEDYAPTAIVINDTLYFLASLHVQSSIYMSADPLSGHWEIAREKLESPMWDPAFFLDNNNRPYVNWLFQYYPIYGIEQGTIYSVTKYGDFPCIIPQQKINDFEEIFPGWMLSGNIPGKFG